MAKNKIDNRPIGIFDSGIGGLTVVKSIIETLPQESLIYFGDSKRCPYGPRPLDETRSFVRQICRWLLKHDVKLIVIACNTGTAAGLGMAQSEFDVPIIGVVEPGARAAVMATQSRKVGVIATSGTIDSGAYCEAIHSLDKGISVRSKATPVFVEIAEEGLRKGRTEDGEYLGEFSELMDCPEYMQIVEDSLEEFRDLNIDTLVMGCTHFPLLKPLIEKSMGDGVEVISSADETARDVANTLMRRGHLAEEKHIPVYDFATTAENPSEFRQLGSLILSKRIENLEQVDLEELENLK